MYPKISLSAVNLQIEAPSGWEVYGGILLALLPIILIAVFFIFILRQAQGAGNQAFSFSKSRARMFTGDKPTVNFSDVAGNEEARQDLAEVVEFLKEPQKFRLARRPHPQRRSASRPARHRQNADGQGRFR